MRSGSPSTGEPEYLVVGVVRRPHGLRGELLVEVITDFPERLQGGAKVFLGMDHRPAVIQSSRPHAGGMLLKLRGLETPESVGVFRNQHVFVAAADRPPLPMGQYYHHQLIGSTVLDEQDRLLGKLTEIIQTGANDVYAVVAPSGDELLLPALDSVILEVDLQQRIVRARLPEVLGDDEPV